MAGEMTPLRSVIKSVQYGLSDKSFQTGDTACVSMGDFRGNSISTDLKGFVRIEPEQIEKFRLCEGDILFNRTNSLDLVGKVASVSKPLNAVFASYLVRIRPDESKISFQYLTQLLSDVNWRARVRRLSTAGVSQYNINVQNLLDLNIPLRSLQEQDSITSLLDGTDIAIRAFENLTVAIERAKSSLMQECALGCSLDPTNRRLGQLFTVRSESGVSGLPILSVSRSQGLVPRESLGRKVESNLTPEQHALVRKGDIAYNMMRMWQGVSGLATCDGLVSPAYVVITAKSDIDPEFASYLFKTPEVIRLFHRYSQGLTDDRLRLYFDQFSDIKMTIPKSIEEQKRLAALFRSFDDRIAELQARITQLTRLKTALSQHFFNPVSTS